MCFRKNGVSYFVWMIFIMCNCVVFSFMGILCARIFAEHFPVAGIGLVGAFFALLFLIYWLTGKAAVKICSMQKCCEKASAGCVKKRLILEGVLTILILAAGVAVRIYMLPSAGESAAYYDVAKVSSDGGSLMVPVQNSVYYYLCLLRGLFFLFGNHWIAGIWLQIVLQVLTGVVLYFAVRRMGGVFAAVAVLSYAMFSPFAVSQGLSYSPQMLFSLLWTMGLLITVLYLSAGTKEVKQDEGKEKVGYNVLMWVMSIVMGVIIGFLGYVDAAGFVLIIPLLMLPMVKRESPKTGVWTARTLVGAVSVIGSFFGWIYLDSILSRASFMRILNAWLITFQFEVPDVMALLQNSSLEIVILLILMSVNVFSFYRRKKTDVLTVWMLMTFVMAILYVMGITTESMNNRMLLMLLMSVVAAIGIRQLVAVDNIVEQEDSPSAEAVQVIDLDPAPKEEIKKPRFIDNPLPLPKKHVKKTMDYAFTPDSSMMKYDVQINENDDFDI